MSLHMCGGAAVCHTGQRRRVAGGQQEEKRRGSRWRGQGGGGDVCQAGWLGSTLGGTDGIKGLSGIRSFFTASAFSSPIFAPHLQSLCPFFSPFQPFFLSMLLLSLLFIVPYLCSAHSFHFCPCVFERPLTAPSLHGK